MLRCMVAMTKVDYEKQFKKQTRLMNCVSGTRLPLKKQQQIKGSFGAQDNDARIRSQLFFFMQWN
jgi:hypothetical protein